MYYVIYIKSRRYPAVTITDEEYADDLPLFADLGKNVEILLQALEKSAKNNGLHINSKKTEYIPFDCKYTINTLEGTPLKKVNNFIYLGSEIKRYEREMFH